MTDWMNDPLFEDMDPIKVNLIRNAAKQVQGKSGNAMAPLMMSLIVNAQKKGIQFTSEEISLILKLLKQGKSEAEQAQIDHTVNMVMTMIKRHGR